VKVGDLVRLTASLKLPLGMIMDIDPCGWFMILRLDGTWTLWPESQMEVVSESR
jgi:hypothetical protein